MTVEELLGMLTDNETIELGMTKGVVEITLHQGQMSITRHTDEEDLVAAAEPSFIMRRRLQEMRSSLEEAKIQYETRR